ncbi:hypothetical protein WJU23_10930 [Prosthecobacter sp. SYSU 5D2]|uniref:hypothetical protein n=1 Tax=Prosthecobacter sp. SYSU 5D2 TaxID=3134134 RepID=UPI0031FF3CED
MNETNERDWAAKTAMRLRIVQAAMVESESEDRGSEVWAFIAEAINELDTDDGEYQRRCMKALDEEFPFFESRPALTEEAAEPPAEAQEPAPASTSALDLVRQLSGMYSSMSTEEREKSSRMLAEAGFPIGQATAAAAPGSLTAAITLPGFEEENVRLKRTVERILERLGPGSASSTSHGDPRLSLIRCMQMLGLMSEQYLLVHPHIWALWDRLSSSQHHTTSFNRPSLEPSQALADFLKGSSTTRRSDVGDMVTKSFYLLNALVAASGDAGKDFARWFFQKFGPENIQSVMSFETGVSLAGPAEYWKRYVELTQLHNEDEMKEQFNNLLAKAMQRHLQRRPGSTSAG